MRETRDSTFHAVLRKIARRQALNAVAFSLPKTRPMRSVSRSLLRGLVLSVCGQRGQANPAYTLSANQYQTCHRPSLPPEQQHFSRRRTFECRYLCVSAYEAP